MNRRCLTEEECLKNKRAVMKNFPDGLKMSYAHNAKWRPFNNSCIDECPPGYVSILLFLCGFSTTENLMQ